MMKKMFFTWLLALALCFSSVSLVWAAQDAHSGSLNLSKMSQDEIRQLLANAPNMDFAEAELYAQTPSYKAPYAAGRLNDAPLQAVLARLNALRRLAGLPDVALDSSLTEKAQYGAVITAAQGTLSHAPGKPGDMDETFYRLAYEAVSSSNLSAGRILTTTPDGFMNDSDAGNIDRVGHRRWQLNPSMGKTGFGYATTPTGYGRYAVEWSFDRSGAGCDYDFIAWPASGNFPSDLFGGGIAWSVTLNPAKYQTPSQSSVKVALTRQSDGQSWVFSGSGYQAASNGEYFNVETSGYGVNNCIIFRPAGVSAYDGIYTVNIEGLRTSGGQAAALNYQVDFFGLNEVEQPKEPVQPEQPNTQNDGGDNKLTNNNNANNSNDKQSDGAVNKYQPGMTENPFVDVRDGDYFKDTVLWAVQRGITNGTTASTFEPNSRCSNADIMTMLWRAYGRPEVETSNPFKNVSRGDYYYQPALWAYQQGMVTEPDFNWNAPCTRGATMRYIWIAAERMTYSGSIPFTDVSGENKTAIAWAWNAGIATGTTATTFEPNATCTRAEIATFLYRALGGTL